MYLAYTTILEIKRLFDFPFLTAPLIENFYMHINMKDKNALRNTLSKPFIIPSLY